MGINIQHVSALLACYAWQPNHWKHTKQNGSVNSEGWALVALLFLHVLTVLVVNAWWVLEGLAGTRKVGRGTLMELIKQYQTCILLRYALPRGCSESEYIVCRKLEVRQFNGTSGNLVLSALQVIELTGTSWSYHEPSATQWDASVNNDRGLLTRTSTPSYVWQSMVTEMSVKRLLRLLLYHGDPSTGPFTECVTASINLKTKIGDCIIRLWLCQSMSYFPWIVCLHPISHQDRSAGPELDQVHHPGCVPLPISCPPGQSGLEGNAVIIPERIREWQGMGENLRLEKLQNTMATWQKPKNWVWLPSNRQPWLGHTTPRGCMSPCRGHLLGIT